MRNTTFRVAYRGFNVKTEIIREPSLKSPFYLHQKFTGDETDALRLRTIPLAANPRIWYRRNRLDDSYR